MKHSNTSEKWGSLEAEMQDISVVIQNGTVKIWFSSNPRAMPLSLLCWLLFIFLSLQLWSPPDLHFQISALFFLHCCPYATTFNALQMLMTPKHIPNISLECLSKLTCSLMKSWHFSIASKVKSPFIQRFKFSLKSSFPCSLSINWFYFQNLTTLHYFPECPSTSSHQPLNFLSNSPYPMHIFSVLYIVVKSNPFKKSNHATLLLKILHWLSIPMESEVYHGPQQGPLHLFSTI